MAKLILANAFSLNMLSTLMPEAGYEHTITVKTVTSTYVGKKIANGFDSSVGHADIAAVLTGILGIEIPVNRRNDSLLPGDKLLVAQYIGPRLPEGATKLPDDAKIVFFEIEIL